MLWMNRDARSSAANCSGHCCAIRMALKLCKVALWNLHDIVSRDQKVYAVNTTSMSGRFGVAVRSRMARVACCSTTDMA